MKTCIQCGGVMANRGRKSKRCRKCWFQYRKEHPEIVPNYKGGRRKTALGYIRVTCKNHPHVTARGDVLEHRLIMEKHIGRYLVKGEVVHHINGIRDDNRIENLVLLKSALEHQNLHRIKRGNISCKFQGCTRGGYMTRGYCKKHYARWRHHRFRGDSPPGDRKVVYCRICGDKQQAKGLCYKHYLQHYNRYVRK